MRAKLFIFVLFVSCCLMACDSGSNNNTVISNPNVPPPPEKIETHPLPSTQSIIETVENFRATSVSIATYTVNGNNAITAGVATLSNASIVIRVNYSYDGLGTVIPSQAAVTLAIRDLFTGFSNVTASVNAAAMFPLPSHASLIAVAAEQNAGNVRILEYTASNEVIGEFHYGSKQSNTPIKISITYDLGANVTLVEQAVRGLFQHFTNVNISTMLLPPTREEIIAALNNEGATSVNITIYSIGGSTATGNLRAINVAIRFEANYTTSLTSSNGQAVVRNLFAGFTNASIFVGNNIPVNLPTQSQIENAVYRDDYLIANINTYTVNSINASTLISASSIDAIVIRMRATTRVFTGGVDQWGWPLGYDQVIANTSVLANNARSRVNQLFIANGFSHTNNINIVFE